MAFVSTFVVATIAVAGMSGNVQIRYEGESFNPLGADPSEISIVYENEISNAIEEDMVMKCSNVSVLTHGMGGTAADWIASDGTGKYYIDQHTLPYQLCHSLDRDGYRIPSITKQVDNYYVFTPGENGSLAKLVRNEGYDYYVPEAVSNASGIDVSSQMVFIYDGDLIGTEEDGYKDQEIYKDFKASLNKIIVGIGLKQHGYLPKINLIGHSRGGLINLLYAYNYPDLVNNLISLGTPYMGSDWADLLVNYYELVGSDEALKYKDMLDPSHPQLYSGYLKSIDQSVNSYAIGFNQTYSFLTQTLLRLLTNETTSVEEIGSFLSDLTLGMVSEDQCSEFLNSTIKALIEISNIDKIAQGLDVILNILEIELALADLFVDDPRLTDLVELVKSFESLLRNDIIEWLDWTSYIIESDIAVNTDSQIGTTRDDETYYEFDETEIITLGMPGAEDYFSEEYCSEPHTFWVAHNFETKNPDAVEKIISFLNRNGGFHEHRYSWTANSSTHEHSCLCGAGDVFGESHRLSLSPRGDSLHLQFCVDCHYSSLESHAFSYSYETEGEHLRRCRDCFYEARESHRLEAYFILSDSVHKTMCKCGLEGELEAHSFSRSTGRCACGFSRMGPLIGPVVDLVDGPVRTT